MRKSNAIFIYKIAQILRIGFESDMHTYTREEREREKNNTEITKELSQKKRIGTRRRE